MKGKNVILSGGVCKSVVTSGEKLVSLQNALRDPLNKSTQALHDKYQIKDLLEMKSEITYVAMGGFGKSSIPSLLSLNGNYISIE